MDMSQDMIKQIASMLTGDPNVVVKDQVDSSACPISADEVPSDEPCGADDVAVAISCDEPETDDYGMPVGAAEPEGCETGGCAAESMDLQNCENIHEFSKTICDILSSGCCLDDWMQQKLTICKTYISDIKNALEFKKKHS
jgi:hypothetical protein